MDRLKDVFGDSQEVADELCTTADLIESEHGVFDYSYPLREAATHITGLYAEAVKQQAEIDALKAQRDVALKHIAGWCAAIEQNGTSWGAWDKYYKDACRDDALPDIRAELKKAIANARGDL